MHAFIQQDFEVLLVVCSSSEGSHTTSMYSSNLSVADKSSLT